MVAPGGIAMVRATGDVSHMSLDSGLLERAENGEVGWRVYAWNGPWVSLGRFQSPERDLIATCAVPWVRRPTGGKAVLHGHDVTVGLAVPLTNLTNVDHRSIRAVYRLVVDPIIEALRACGVDAALAEKTPYSNCGNRTADCFAYSSANDVVSPSNGRKLCGCALRLTHKAVLLQASIPNGGPLVDPRTVIANASHESALRWDDDRFGDKLAEAVEHMTLVASR